MRMSTLNRLAVAVSISAILAAMGFASHAESQSDARQQQQAEAKQEKQDEKDDRKDEKASQKAHQQMERLQNDRYDFDTDPFYYTPPNYRYRRDARYYETNQYGVDVLRQASNTGYQEGLLAGRADKQDNWRFDYRQSFAYQDANYGYDGRYVQQEDYNHYFREGFQRGYDDGYYERRQYGRNTGGADSLLDAVLGAILSLEALR
jgi:flagellar biosynthesis/type III secretory pathway protein FliH